VVANWNNESSILWCEKCCYVGWSSSVLDITGAKEMSSVSVCRSKILRLLVVECYWKCAVWHLSRPVLNGLTRYSVACKRLAT